MLIWESKSRRVHLLLEWRTPGGRVMARRYNPMFIDKNAPELCLLVVREGRNRVCDPEKRLLFFSGGDLLICGRTIFCLSLHCLDSFLLELRVVCVERERDGPDLLENILLHYLSYIVYHISDKLSRGFGK